MHKSLIQKPFLVLLVFFALNLIGVSSIFGLESSLAIIQFDGIQDSYSRHDIIEFEIHNQTGNDLLFYCAVEKEIDGQWREVVPSIDAVRVSKSVKLNEIPPNKTRQLVWDRDKESFYPDIDSGMFRFKLEILDKQDKTTIGSVYSKAFKVSP